ncbi:hypothetical protein RchiOBHm_Chr1g0322571 [Rosa chinensis]|uniref:Uncharacterized protein n=1 Tax=Rosa chinensis TaxID=74649 RepID=A0A2P6S9C1_ROSCH|nr:hypothetical protein RchiOBHm_Chr1g0322571 [Rosa chinensis]
MMIRDLLNSNCSCLACDFIADILVCCCMIRNRRLASFFVSVEVSLICMKHAVL